MITNIEFWSGNELCDGGMRVSWFYDDIGYGQLDFIKTDDGDLMIDTEYMGKAFVQRVLSELIEGATID